jgi:DNA-binding PadR family transcriptional regulator
MPPTRREQTRSASQAARQLRDADDLRSPASWLVLALVIEQASHGYEISQRYQRRFGAYLSMSVPRLYAALDRLRDSGLIEPVVLTPAKATRKQHLMRRTYRATEAGMQAYRDWVAERMKDDSERPQVLARIASAGLSGTDAVLDVIDRYQRECMAELRALDPGSEPLESGRSSLEELTESLVVDQRRRELRARVDWATHARQVLKARKRAGSAKTRAQAADADESIEETA